MIRSSKQWQHVMRADWDARARANAMHYIASEEDTWDADAFFASGEQQVARPLDPFLRARNFDPAPARVLEIGCGVGRLTRSLAQRFTQVDALDVSPEMIARGRELLADYPNINWLVGSGVDLRDLPSASYDCVFSFIVFQHLPTDDLVLNYIAEIGRVLKPGGLYKFQLRTVRYEPLPLWRLRVRLGVAVARLVDQLIARSPLAEGCDKLKAGRARSWTGNAVRLSQLRRALKDAGLSYHIEDPATQYTWASGMKKV